MVMVDLVCKHEHNLLWNSPSIVIHPHRMFLLGPTPMIELFRSAAACLLSSSFGATGLILGPIYVSLMSSLRSVYMGFALAEIEVRNDVLFHFAR